MDRTQLTELLLSFQKGEIDLEEVLLILKDFPLWDLGFAQLDTHRALRQGFPEVVFGRGKTASQIVEIVSRLAERNEVVLATHIEADTAQQLLFQFPHSKYFSLGQTLIIRKSESQLPAVGKAVLIITAGTSDIPVAEEAQATLEALSFPYRTIYDIGVAGIHRIIKHIEAINKASAIIVIAGMEGALASIVAGLTSAPVIAVPTSVGYGASFGGLSALLGMLNSCSSGLLVVNIDNGFGAAVAAAKMLKLNRN
jgi:NCAIR mutase (PurE)-related protein